MGMVGIEPTREVIPKVFETFASANSATSPQRSEYQFKRETILAVRPKARQLKKQEGETIRSPSCRRVSLVSPVNSLLFRGRLYIRVRVYLGYERARR